MTRNVLLETRLSHLFLWGSLGTRLSNVIHDPSKFEFIRVHVSCLFNYILNMVFT